MVMRISNIPSHGKPGDFAYPAILVWETLEKILADEHRTYLSKEPGKHELVPFLSGVEAMIEFICSGIGYFWFRHKPTGSTHDSLRAALKAEVSFEETPARALHYFGLLQLLHRWLKDDNECMLPIPDEEIRKLINFLKCVQVTEDQV